MGTGSYRFCASARRQFYQCGYADKPCSATSRSLQAAEGHLPRRSAPAQLGGQADTEGTEAIARKIIYCRNQPNAIKVHRKRAIGNVVATSLSACPFLSPTRHVKGRGINPSL